MKIFIAFILTLFLVVFIPAYGMREASRQDKALARITNQSAERGAEIYITACASCHGQQGEGGVGPALSNTKLEREALFKAISFGRLAQVIPMPALGVDMGGPLKKHQIEDIVNFIQNWEQSLIIKAHSKHASAAAPSEAVVAKVSPVKAVPGPPDIEKTPTAPQAAGKASEESADKSLPTQEKATVPPSPSAPSAPEQVLLEGKELYANFGCAACHGPGGKGAVGPSLLGMNKDEVVRLVRIPSSPAMPPYSEERLPQTNLDKIIIFLNSLNKKTNP